jgi:hypothetical protein
VKGEEEMKKIHTFILTIMIFVVTGLFPVAAWASPGPSDFQGTDRQYNTSAGKGGGSSSDEGSSIYIPSDAHYVNGHYYKMYEMDYTWTEASEYCTAQGGHLMTITSAEEQAILQDLGLKSGTNYWIGGTDSKREGRWKWVTGEKWIYTEWADGEPDNSQLDTGIDEDYLQVAVDWDYGWNDSAEWQDKTAGIGFICEWEPNSNANSENPDPDEMNLFKGLLEILQL